MKIALITLHTPTSTNFCGASALPYHISKFRGNIELEIWSFNNNNCNKIQISQSEVDLNTRIHIIPSIKIIKYLSFSLVRLFLPYPFQYYISLPTKTINEINNFLGDNKANGVWIYGEELSRHIRNFIKYRCVITTPDCEAMYYYRMLAESGVPVSWKKLIRYSLMYYRYSKMAHEFQKGNNIKYHLVGNEDKYFLNMLNPDIDTYFIRHPHYDICEKKINHTIQKNEKLRLLIAGRYDIYMSKAVDQAVMGIISIANEIKDRYHITFLGRNWDKTAKLLMGAGFSVEMKEYVEDYVSEVSSHHIQLTPISVGTGTKGKVLDAFANGLMVIGTARALENIAVENRVSCVLYETPQELADWLLKLAKLPMKIIEIAKAGHDAILKYHGRENIAKDFFSLFS